MFKRAWWKFWTVESLPPTWQQLVTSWDMTFKDTESAAASYVVGQVWGVDGADRYLLAQVRAQLGFTDTQKAVKAMADYIPDARAKLVEEKANGAAVIDSLKSKVGGLVPIQPEGGKEARAAAVEPLVEAGNVYLPDAEHIPAPRGYEATSVTDFIEECAVFPNGTHDDQVDTMTQALNWLETRSGGASTQSRLREGSEHVVRRGDLVLRGEKYIDKP